MPRTCTREGCNHEVLARGLCNNHYCQWRRAKVKRTGQNLGRGGEHRDAEIKAAMPGTYAQLAAECSMSYDGVRKAVIKLRAAGEVFISDFDPPLDGVSGSRWSEVFDVGNQPDARLTKKRKHAHHLMLRRRRAAVRRPAPHLKGVLAMLHSRPANDAQQQRAA